MISYATGAKLLNYPDDAGPAGLRLVPEVAASLPRRSADGRTYTFKIRRGFRFSPPSNEPVTAQTFKSSIERALSPRCTGRGRSSCATWSGPTTTRRKGQAHRGDHRAGRHLDFPPRPSLGRFHEPARDSVLHGCADRHPDRSQAVRTVHGAGPYYVAFHSREMIVLRPNPNYHGPRPHRLREIRIAIGVGQRRALGPSRPVPPTMRCHPFRTATRPGLPVASGRGVSRTGRAGSATSSTPRSASTISR